MISDLAAFIIISAAVISLIVMFYGSSIPFVIISFLSGFSGILFLYFGPVNISTFFILASLISIGAAFRKRKMNEIFQGIIASSFIILLLFLSTSIRISNAFLSPGTFAGYLFSIYDNASPIGIPWTYFDGIVVSIGRVTLTFSPLTATLFPIISYLTSNNTFMIIRKYRRIFWNGGLSTTLSILSCQCETTIGVVSGTASAYLLSFIPFLIVISLILLILTNLYLRDILKFSYLSLNRGVLFIIFILTILFEELIISYGLIGNMMFFAALSFLSMLSGLLAGQIIPVKNRFVISGTLIAILMELVSFMPLLFKQIMLYIPYFELYTLSGFIGGIILAFSAKPLRPRLRDAVYELFFSMQVMMSAGLLYTSIYFGGERFVINLTDVVGFSFVMLVLALPIMWILNLKLLSFERILIKNENNIL